MLTAAITAAITGILALFGVQLSVGQVAIVAVVVKVIIVAVGVTFGVKLALRRRNAAAAADQAKAPPDPKSP
jgi:hypothetical protein